MISIPARLFINKGVTMHDHSNDREKMLEAMLFASPESVPLASLAEALGCDIPLTRNLLTRMAEAYAKNQSGIQL